MTLSYIGVEGILCLYAIGIQKYMYKLTVHHFVICSINRYILSKTSFQKNVSLLPSKYEEEHL